MDQQWYEWVAREGRAGTDRRQSIQITTTGFETDSDGPIRFEDVEAVKLEQSLDGPGTAAGATAFDGNLLRIDIVAAGRAVRLKGSLSSRDHRVAFVTAASAFLAALAEARPDLTYREVKDPKTDRDSRIWGGLLLAVALVMIGYGLATLALPGRDMSVWSIVMPLLGTLIGGPVAYLLVWPTFRAPEAAVSGEDVAARLGIAPLNVLKWPQALPNIIVSGPFAPSEFSTFD